MLIHVQHNFLMSHESSMFYRGTFINSATPLVQNDYYISAETKAFLK